MQSNEENFSKVKSVKAHKDKMHKVKNENKTRDGTMKGELNRDECDEEEVCQFLNLSKIPKRLMLDEEDSTQMSEWKQVARKAKKRNTSSTFSMRDGTAC